MNNVIKNSIILVDSVGQPIRGLIFGEKWPTFIFQSQILHKTLKLFHYLCMVARDDEVTFCAKSFEILAISEILFCQIAFKSADTFVPFPGLNK